MPTDVSHLPPTPIWFHPYGPEDDRGPVVRWQAHLEGSHESNTLVGSVGAGRLGSNPPVPPHVIAQRDVNTAPFARRATDRRRLAQEYGQ